MTSENNSPANAASAAEISAHLARKIGELPKLALPDEWYSAEGDTLAARFAATAERMRASNPTAPSAGELMSQFENGGRPFVHSVWLFQPLRCEKCTGGGSNGFHTVMSVRLGLHVRLTAREMHAVLAHGESFPAEKLTILTRILDSR